MSKHNVVALSGREKIRDELTELIRDGAHKLIAQGLELEVSELLSALSGRRDEVGRTAVVRNGYQPARDIQTGIGPVTVKVPKIRSRDRKTASLEAALPWLYLKGIATGEMQPALEVLLDLNTRGMNAPELAVGDGALGFWAALEEVFPATRQQRCWMHKTGNVLNAMPKSVQPKAKSALHEIWQAATGEHAEQAFDQFIVTYEARYPKATNCLLKDRQSLMTFYDFPAVHWQHLRTTNPIESTFATIRHRTTPTKGCMTRDSLLHMMFKLGQCAEKNWRKLRGFAYLAKIVEGVKFINGEEIEQSDQVAA